MLESSCPQSTEEVVSPRSMSDPCCLLGTGPGRVQSSPTIAEVFESHASSTLSEGGIPCDGTVVLTVASE